MPKLRAEIPRQRLRVLFDLVVRGETTDDSGWLDEVEIPMAAPAPGATLRFLRNVLGDPGLQGMAEATVETATVGLLAAGMLEPEPS